MEKARREEMEDVWRGGKARWMKEEQDDEDWRMGDEVAVLSRLSRVERKRSILESKGVPKGES